MKNMFFTQGRRGAKRHAFTLLEMMITMSIMVVVISMISLGYLSMLRLEKSNGVLLDFIRDCNKLKQTLRSFAGSSIRLIGQNGRSVRIQHGNGGESLIQYEDDDNDFTTIGDNRLVFIRDNINYSSNDEAVIVRYISPANLGGGGEMTDGEGNTGDPIFSRQSGEWDDADNNNFSALVVEFVLGDNDPSPGASCHAFTGPGYQSYTFRMRMTPRNTFR
jgi:prepilin-type N-terminal cleavage/methylation domain-containing protein